MKLVAGSYVILKLANNKPELIRCTVADGNEFKGVVEKEKEVDGKSATVLTFEKNDVMAVIGKKPKVGKVYGLNIEPLVRREHYRFWGDARIYNWFDDEQSKLLKAALEEAYHVLKKLRVAGPFKVELEVRQPQGKFAGMYKHRPKADTDILIIKPEKAMEDLRYIIFHEYAHGIWYRMMTPKMRLSWVKMYHKYITLQEIKSKELKDILGEVESLGSIRAFMRECDEDTKLQLKEIVKHITNIHSLSVSHLEMLMEDGESLSEYWPSNIEMSEKEVAITDYARKSPEEFFAEAIAHKFSDRKLPKAIEELYAKTMSRLVKGAHGVEAQEEIDEEEASAKKKKKSKNKEKESTKDKKPSKAIKVSYDGPDEEPARKGKKDKRKKTLS